MITKIFIKKYLKYSISKTIDLIDYFVSYILSKLFTGVRNSKILLIPAGDLSGGFGEDIMVCSFLNHFKERQVDLAVRKVYSKEYAKNCQQYPILDSRFINLKLVLLLRKYEELQVIGADIMCGEYSKSALLRFRALKLARNMSLRTNLTGLSVVENMNSKDKKRFTHYSKHNIVKARDVISYNRLTTFLSKDKVVLTADIAFLCPNISRKNISYDQCNVWVNEKRKKGKHIVAFCPNTIQMKKCSKDIYLDNMHYLIQVLLENNCAVLMLYHDLRKYALNTNDKEISEYLCKQINSAELFFVDDLEDGVQLKNYLALCDFTFTGRMHFGISGYVAGKPMFGISYYGKFEGLQKMMGIDPALSLLEYNHVNGKEMTIRQFISTIAINQKNVAHNIGAILSLAKKNF